MKGQNRALSILTAFVLICIGHLFVAGLSKNKTCNVKLSKNMTKHIQYRGQVHDCQALEAISMILLRSL